MFTPRSIGSLIAAALSVYFVVGCGPTADLRGESGPTSTPATPSAGSLPRAVAKAITHGPRNRPFVAITIDADYSPAAQERVRDGRYPRQVNKAVMELLNTGHVPATVFVTGMWAKEYRAEFDELRTNPNVELANHTWNHDAWTEDCYGLPSVGTVTEKVAELQRTNTFVTENGGPEMFWFRFPGLCHNQRDLKLVADNGLQSVDTDVTTSDAFAKDGNGAADAMLAKTKPGSILLFHLNGQPNAPATAVMLRKVVAGLKTKGLAPVTLGKMFASS